MRKIILLAKQGMGRTCSKSIPFVRQVNIYLNQTDLQTLFSTKLKNKQEINTLLW
jgi:hypothetical protein